LGEWRFFLLVRSISEHLKLKKGAGQEIGRSCFILKLFDKTIMLDCGLHIGYSDMRRYPDFSLICPKGESKRKTQAPIKIGRSKQNSGLRIGYTFSLGSLWLATILIGNGWI